MRRVRHAVFRTIVRPWPSLIAAWLVLGVATPLRAQFAKPYRVIDLADGVFAVVWDDVLRFPVEGNNLVVIGERGVTVVDANRTPTLADTVIALIRTRTSKPVRYVINTHWHADHVQGNASYVREFPGVEIIAHPGTLAGFIDVLEPWAREVVARSDSLRAIAPDDSLHWTAEARDAYAAALAEWDREGELYRGRDLIRPTLLVRDTLTVDDPARRIRVFHPGPANTAGDLVVSLPDDGILAVGDLVTPFPFLGYDSPRSWSQALTSLLALDTPVVLPGHGDVMRSADRLVLFRDFLRELTAQVARQVAAGRGVEELAPAMALDAYLVAFADGNERILRYLRGPFLEEAVERAYLEQTRG